MTGGGGIITVPVAVKEGKRQTGERERDVRNNDHC